MTDGQTSMFFKLILYMKFKFYGTTGLYEMTSQVNPNESLFITLGRTHTKRYIASEKERLLELRYTLILLSALTNSERVC